MEDLSKLDDLALVRQIQHGNELKILLLAITLRLAGNLNITQIIKAITILALVVGFYWWGGSILGWFKVPFI